MYHLKLIIQGLPKTTNGNGRGHWRALHAHAKIWQRNVVVAIAHHRPRTALTHAKLILTRHSSKVPDFDGLVSSFKHCIDGLKVAGVIIDDKMSVIGQPTYLWEMASPREGFVTIEVMEVSGERVMDDASAHGRAI